MDLVNAKILLNLDYPDIVNSCKALPQFARVCDTEYFWALKAEKDFGIPEDELLLVPGNVNRRRYLFIYNTKDPSTGLIEASKIGSLALVKYFLDQGADIHAEEDEALLLASLYGHLDIVKYLVEHGADLHGNKHELILKRKNGLAQLVTYVDVFRFLNTFGKDLIQPNETNLMAAVENDHLDVADYLIKQGADFHVNDEQALKLAATRGYLDIVEYLVELGADIRVFDEKALKLLEKNGRYEVVDYLIEQGANTPGFDQNALEWAKDKGDIEPNEEDGIQGIENALISMATKGQPGIVKVLLEQGVNIHADNDAALIGAASNGYLTIVKYLVRHGADIHARNDEALRLADYYDHEDIVKYLLSQGADARVLNEKRSATTGEKVKSYFYKGMKKFMPY